MTSDAADVAAVERAAMRRVSIRLLPFLFALYICAYVDRVNVGIASLQMNRDLHFTATAYGFGAGIFFLGYALFEVPSNLILARTGARRWIARIMITWGLLASAMMFVRTPMSLYVLRFLLGVAEAGFFPGIVFFMTGWFPAAYRARAVSRFMVAVPVAGVVSGAIAGPLLTLDGRLGLAGWQWVFLLEGLPSIVLGVAVLAYLTDSPREARWLPPAERDWLVARLESERRARVVSHGARLRDALANGRVWQLGLLWALVYISATAYAFWAPHLINALFASWSAGRVGDILAAMSLAAGAAMLLNGLHSDRRRERPLHVAVPLATGTLAWILVAASDSSAVRLLGLALVAASTNALYGPFWCLPSAMLTGEAAAGGLALISSLGALGGFMGPNVVGVAERATGSLRAGYFILAALTGLGALVVLRIRHDPRLTDTGTSG